MKSASIAGRPAASNVVFGFLPARRPGPRSPAACRRRGTRPGARRAFPTALRESPRSSSGRKRTSTLTNVPVSASANGSVDHVSGNAPAFSAGVPTVRPACERVGDHRGCSTARRGAARRTRAPRPSGRAPAGNRRREPFDLGDARRAASTARRTIPPTATDDRRRACRRTRDSASETQAAKILAVADGAERRRPEARQHVLFDDDPAGVAASRAQRVAARATNGTAPRPSSQKMPRRTAVW